MIEALQAEIERLRAERNDLQVLLRGRTTEFQAEIERLRNAGDALVGALENNLMATAVVLVNQWKEARRG